MEWTRKLVQLCVAVTSVWTEINGAAAFSQRHPPPLSPRSPSASQFRRRACSYEEGLPHTSVVKIGYASRCGLSVKSHQTGADETTVAQRSDAHWTSFKPSCVNPREA